MSFGEYFPNPAVYATDAAAWRQVGVPTAFLAEAICIVCGMALCPEHAIREEVPVYETVETGMTATRHKLPAALPRIVCPECHQALHQAR